MLSAAIYSSSSTIGTVFANRSTIIISSQILPKRFRHPNLPQLALCLPRCYSRLSSQLALTSFPKWNSPLPSLRVEYELVDHGLRDRQPSSRHGAFGIVTEDYPPMVRRASSDIICRSVVLRPRDLVLGHRGSDGFTPLL